MLFIKQKETSRFHSLNNNRLDISMWNIKDDNKCKLCTIAWLSTSMEYAWYNTSAFKQIIDSK